MAIPLERLCDEFGGIDIYWFDQLLRGRITGSMRVLDAGCGTGRNMRYLLRSDVDVYGIDSDPAAVEAAREQARAFDTTDEATRIREGVLESLPWPQGFFDAVICSAVLHFARDEEHFLAMVRELWRVLSPGGLLFARLASRDGLGDRPRHVGKGRYVLPDGSTRFLVDATVLSGLTARLGGQLVDPLKTTLVHDQRAMTTWVMRRASVASTFV